MMKRLNAGAGTHFCSRVAVKIVSAIYKRRKVG